MRRRGRSPWRLAAWIVVAATPAGQAVAQLSAGVDAGWASVHYDEYLRSSVFTVSPGLRLDFPRSSIVGRGTLSMFESGSRSVDLALGASTFTGAFGPFRLELSGSGGGSVYNGFGTGHASAGLRLHVLGSRRGLWLSGTGGYVDDGVLPATLGRYGAGAWTRIGGLGLSATVNHLRAELVAVTDFEASLRWSLGSLHLGAGGGLRAGGATIPGAKRWGDVSAVWWLSDYVALIGAHGRYPSEPARGTPGGSYTTVAFRIATRPPVLNVAIPRRGRDDEADPLARPVVATFEVRREADSTYVIRARAPGALRLEIAGDFTQWKPTALEKGTGDSFTLSMSLSPGSHKFNVRVDGGEWGVPPGVPVMRDEFSGFVALLIIQ